MPKELIMISPHISKYTKFQMISKKENIFLTVNSLYKDSMKDLLKFSYQTQWENVSLSQNK